MKIVPDTLFWHCQLVKEECSKTYFHIYMLKLIYIRNIGYLLILMEDRVLFFEWSKEIYIFTRSVFIPMINLYKPLERMN